MASGNLRASVPPNDQGVQSPQRVRNPFYLADLSLRTWTSINFLSHVSIGHIFVTIFPKSGKRKFSKRIA